MGVGEVGEICNNDLKWEPVSEVGVRGQCIAKCENWPDVENGLKSITNGYTVDGELYTTAVEYTCFPEYLYNVAVSTVVCLGDDKFDNAIGDCKKVCKEPIPLTSGNHKVKSHDEVLGDEKLVSDSVLTFSCNEGLIFRNGDEEYDSTCNEDGDWSPIPNCIDYIDGSSKERCYNSYSYHLTEKGTFSETKAYCESIGGNLINKNIGLDENSLPLNELDKLRTVNGEVVPILLGIKITSAALWTREDGTVVSIASSAEVLSTGNWLQWGAGKPSINTCVELGTEGKLSDVFCSPAVAVNKIRGFCEVEDKFCVE